MADMEKKRGIRKYKNLNISRTKRGEDENTKEEQKKSHTDL